MYIDNLCRLRDMVRRKFPPKLRTNSWFLLHVKTPSHQLDLVKNFLAKNTVTSMEHLQYSPDWLQLIFTYFLKWNQTWRYSAFVMLLTSLSMLWKSREGFHKMTSRNVSITFTVTGRSVWLHKGTILKEMWLKWLYCSVFLINKVILGTFWRYHI